MMYVKKESDENQMWKKDLFLGTDIVIPMGNYKNVLMFIY